MNVKDEVQKWASKAADAIESGDPSALRNFEQATGMKAAMFNTLHKAGQLDTLEQSLVKHVAAAEAKAASEIKYSPEQQAVIDCQDPKVVVKAFAGAGKTTTAIGYSKARPQERILYVCLNKANQQEAQARFPSNVTCRTSHSLAYAAFGRNMVNRLENRWKAKHVSMDMGIDPRMGAAVYKVLNGFLSSSDPTPSMAAAVSVTKEMKLPEYRAQDVHSLSNRLWQRMCDPKDTVAVTHDAYLKMWALSKPQLNYDVVILDEAQDTNPITQDVILAQKKARLLLIGDSHQSIYAFRGATNAMEVFSEQGATVLSMPTTRRFGQKTADYCNALLRNFKEESVSIVGLGKDMPYNGKDQMAYLSRSNAGLFAMAASSRGEGCYWVGGASNYRLELLVDAFNLYSGLNDRVRDPLLQRYPDWTTFTEEQEITQDVENNILIKVVEEYRDDIPQLVQDILENEVLDENLASYVLTTAHKSKGLDWDYVTIGDDFEVCEPAAEMMLEKGSLNGAMQQEVNLLYVAISRARHEVFLNEDTKLFMQDMGVYVEKDDNLSLSFDR